jgi:hypothetical protein
MTKTKPWTVVNYVVKHWIGIASFEYDPKFIGTKLDLAPINATSQ